MKADAPDARFQNTPSRKHRADRRRDVGDDFVDALEDRGVMPEQRRSDDREQRARGGGRLADEHQPVVAQVRLITLEQIVRDQRGGGIQRGRAGLHRGGEHGGDDQALQTRSAADA